MESHGRCFGLDVEPRFVGVSRSGVIMLKKGSNQHEACCG